jgi:hypothetical protein
MKSIILAGAMLAATITGAYATQYYVYQPSSGDCAVIDNAGNPGPNRKMKFEGKAFPSEDAANAAIVADATCHGK